MKVAFSVTNNNPDTIWNALAKKLGREPTDAEAIEEIQRIRNDWLARAAARGELSWQKRKSK